MMPEGRQLARLSFGTLFSPARDRSVQEPTLARYPPSALAVWLDRAQAGAGHQRLCRQQWTLSFCPGGREIFVPPQCTLPAIGFRTAAAKKSGLAAKRKQL